MTDPALVPGLRGPGPADALRARRRRAGTPAPRCCTSAVRWRRPSTQTRSGRACRRAGSPSGTTGTSGSRSGTSSGGTDRTSGDDRASLRTRPAGAGARAARGHWSAMRRPPGIDRHPHQRPCAFHRTSGSTRSRSSATSTSSSTAPWRVTSSLIHGSTSCCRSGWTSTSPTWSSSTTRRPTSGRRGAGHPVRAGSTHRSGRGLCSRVRSLLGLPGGGRRWLSSASSASPR